MHSDWQYLKLFCTLSVLVCFMADDELLLHFISTIQQQQGFCCLCREHVACLGGALHLENSSPLIAGNNLHTSITFLLFSSFHIQTSTQFGSRRKKIIQS
jgi:hypothetical protein